LPCIRGLDHHTKNMVSKYHSGFVQGLKLSLKKCDYEENETYILAAILDHVLNFSGAQMMLKSRNQLIQH